MCANMRKMDVQGVVLCMFVGGSPCPQSCIFNPWNVANRLVRYLDGCDMFEDGLPFLLGHMDQGHLLTKVPCGATARFLEFEIGNIHVPRLRMSIFTLDFALE